MSYTETLRAALDGVMRYLDGHTKSCGHTTRDCPCALHAARAALADTAESPATEYMNERIARQYAAAADPALAEPEQITIGLIICPVCNEVPLTECLECHGCGAVVASSAQMRNNVNLQKLHTLTAQLAAMTAKYQELIYQVGKKYPGESRHQTALRYLGQAEQDGTDYSVAAIAATKGK